MGAYTIRFYRNRARGREEGPVLTIHAADDQAAIRYAEAKFPEGLSGFDERALSEATGKVIWKKMS